MITNIAFVIAKHFDYLPEIIRDELLFNLSNIKPAQNIVASILKLIPEPLRKKNKNRLKIKDEED